MTLSILNKQLVMVDTETLSVRQNGVIVSIGACKFTINGGITDKFSVNIDPKSSLSYNLKVDKDTIEWWAKQPKEIQESWQKNPKPLPEALQSFNTWLGNCKDTLMVANGSVFDFGLLRFSYETTKIPRPWEFWNEIDLRTISILLDIQLSKGNTHSALEDAVNQAEQMRQIFLTGE